MVPVEYEEKCSKSKGDELITNPESIDFDELLKTYGGRGPTQMDVLAPLPVLKVSPKK